MGLLSWGWTAKKLEERAEEIVNAYLRAGVEGGDWRALDALVNRVYGRPKETFAVEQENPVRADLLRFSPEERMQMLVALREKGKALQAGEANVAKSAPRENLLDLNRDEVLRRRKEAKEAAG
jgi:hypothetical protein